MDHKRGFWIGHQMLGDVLGFCAAAHLLHLKVKDTIKIHFQESRKGITKYFDGIEWVPKQDIPQAIDCGIDPNLSEWPNMNGVKRFYRFMDPSLLAPKSFDVHMNIQKREGKYIGLITRSHTQGHIDNETVIRMCNDAKMTYPGLPIILLGEKNYDCKLPDGVEDRRDNKPDFDALIEQIRDIKLLLTPQTGPCFIAVGLGIEMWVYRSKEAFWDNVLNYDNYRVTRWYDRPNKIFIYGNWKHGLGDCIVHLSLYYWWSKHKGEKVYFYACDEKVEENYNEILEVYRKNNIPIDDHLVLVPRKEFIINNKEQFDIKYKPIPSDNTPHREWFGFFMSNFIAAFIKAMKFEDKIRKPDELFFKCGYIPCTERKIKRQVTIQLIGITSGDYNNYLITTDDIINIIKHLVSLNINIKIFSPVNDFIKSLANDNVTIHENKKIYELYEEIGSSIFHIGIDSGLSHVALSCGTPLFLFKPKNIPASLFNFMWNDPIVPPLDLVSQQTYNETYHKMSELIEAYDNNEPVRRYISLDKETFCIDLSKWRNELLRALNRDETIDIEKIKKLTKLILKQTGKTNYNILF